jgi:hypothetical protein
MNERNTSRWIVISFEKKFNEKIETPYVKSGDQLADIFTKEIDPESFEENTCKLGRLIYIPPA